MQITALNLLSPTTTSSSLDPVVYAKHSVPSLEEFRELWKTWDMVSQQMLPQKELLSKPIHLRNCCIFYLGHLPAFIDIHLTRTTRAAATEPALYQKLFERGIDPDVDNPELCHAHSEIPDTWPDLDDILEYQRRVRQRIVSLFDDGLMYRDRDVGRAVWLGFEHDGKKSFEVFLPANVM